MTLQELREIVHNDLEKRAAAIRDREFYTGFLSIEDQLNIAHQDIKYLFWLINDLLKMLAEKEEA